MTKQEFENLKPCKEGLAWALAQPSLAAAWDTCERSDWMWWLLRKLNKAPKELVVQYANWLAGEAEKHKDAVAAAYDTADAAADAAVAAAYDTAYDTAADAADAADAVAAAAAADAAAAAAAAAERKKQANYLRSIVANPFNN